MSGCPCHHRSRTFVVDCIWVHCCEIEAKVRQTWVAPRIDVDTGLCELRCCQDWSDDFSLGSQTCLHTSTMDDLAAGIMQGHACSSNEALAAMSSKPIKRNQAACTRLPIRAWTPLVLAQSLLHKSEVKSDTHIDGKLHIVKRFALWTCIGSEPKRILITTQILQPLLVWEEGMQAVSCNCKRCLPQTLSLPQRRHVGRCRIELWDASGAVDWYAVDINAQTEAAKAL